MKRHEKDLQIIKCDINIKLMKWGTSVMSSNLFSNPEKLEKLLFLLIDEGWWAKKGTERTGQFPWKPQLVCYQGWSLLHLSYFPRISLVWSCITGAPVSSDLRLTVRQQRSEVGKGDQLGCLFLWYSSCLSTVTLAVAVILHNFNSCPGTLSSGICLVGLHKLRPPCSCLAPQI